MRCGMQKQNEQKLSVSRYCQYGTRLFIFDIDVLNFWIIAAFMPFTFIDDAHISSPLLSHCHA